MKKGVLIFSVTAGLSLALLSSYEHGPAHDGGLNRTGSQGGVANCAGSSCHAANVATTVVAVNVTTTSGATVTSYVPGTTYNVSITGHNTASVSLDEFGFQVSAVLSSTLQAGNFAVPSGVNLRVESLGSLQIVEHKNTLHDTAANYSVAHFYWTAPAAGSGTVQFYGILNALGDGGSGSSGGGGGGYYPNVAPVVTLTESGGGGTNGLAQENAATIGLQLYPNPCSDVLRVWAQPTTGSVSVGVYAISGQCVYATDLSGMASTGILIPTVSLPVGLYVAVLSIEGKVVRQLFSKQ